MSLLSLTLFTKLSFRDSLQFCVAQAVLGANLKNSSVILRTAHRIVLSSLLMCRSGSQKDLDYTHDAFHF